MNKLNFSWGKSAIKSETSEAKIRLVGASNSASISRGDSENPSFYRSVILVVSASLFCLVTGESAQAQSQTLPPPPGTNPDSSSSNTNAASASGVGDLMLPPPTLKTLEVNNNEISASADFMYGQGTVNLPIGFAFAHQFPEGNVHPSVISAQRSSLYYGGTISYSYGRSWYFDFSYEQGNSSGNQTVDIPNTTGPGSFPSNFKITDDLYQFYVRYNFQNLLAGTRFRAYLRAGASYYQATLTADDQNSPSLYSQRDQTSDVLGNIGFGLTYSLHSSVRIKLGLQAEGEGFYGLRSQDSDETLLQDTPQVTAHTTINNNLYGGTARFTFHGDYLLGQSGRLKLTTDAGFEVKYTIVTYSGISAPDELLYGPYVKVGLSYLF